MVGRLDQVRTGWAIPSVEPTTVYAQVQLIDPFDDGSCTQGDFGADCDSQVIALTVQPICSQVLVKAGHWLRKKGHYVRHHGHRVWVKPKYKLVYHPAVYQTQCH